ncbi:MAG TPA: hypothetical protein VE713_02650 [Pyrinomonadaceae bacterium]|jgi:NhaP-type Na+/H+ or K+/H+ antiporter|nr:hypothetical protein [Pyrinomonadaceae bacterium]
MCLDGWIIFVTLLWLVLGNALVGLTLFLVVRYFVRRRDARR